MPHPTLDHSSGSVRKRALSGVDGADDREEKCLRDGIFDDDAAALFHALL
jgi:hypothetical protein